MIPRIYIRDVDDKTIATLDHGDYFNDTLTRFLAGKASMLEFTILKKEGDYELFSAGKKLSFAYEGEEFWLNMMVTDQDEKNLTVTALSLNLEFNNETVGSYSGASMSFEQYLTQMLNMDHTLTIGINEVSDKRISNEWTGTSTLLARLFSLATVFSAELEFVSGLNPNGSLKGIVVNVYKEHSDTIQGLGADRRNETFRFGKDIKTVRKTEDTTSLYTAIRPYGKDGLSIASIEREILDENGKILFATYKTPKLGFMDPGKIYAPQSRDIFPSTIGGDTDRWIVNEIDEMDYESAEALFGYSLGELKKNCVPQTEWEISGYIPARIGDTIRVADDGYKPEIYLDARITEQTISFTNPSQNKSTFSNVVERQSEISTNLLDEVAKLVEANKVYATGIATDNGIVFKDDTDITTLTAIVRDNGVSVADNFTINWYKDDSIVATGKSITVQAADIEKTAVYRFEALKEDGTIAGEFTITLTRVYDGKDGLDGLDGAQGPVGPPGKDGEEGLPGTSGEDGSDGKGVIDTIIEYAQSTSGTVAPTTGYTGQVPTLVKGQYLWARTTWEYTDGTSEYGYTVSYNAKDGNSGSDGKAGKDGVGITDTVIEYVVSTSGMVKPTTGWSETIPSVPAGQYLWTRVKWIYSDGTNEYGYSSALSGKTGPAGKDGQDGVAGKDGVGLKSTAITYAQSTSGTTAPTTGWTGAVPTLVKGQYLWTRTIWNYTDNTSETGYTVSYNANDGNNGTDGIAGKDGVGIESTVITYAKSASGTTAPTTGYTSTVPSVPEGQFLWTKTVWTYTDNSSETGYSVAMMGVKGSTGATGPKGDTGSTGPKGDPTGVTESATIPATKYVGMLWKNIGTNAGYLANTVYQWTGTDWKVFTFSAENILANTLSAITANLGNVTGGTFTGGKFVNNFSKIAISGGDGVTASGTLTIENGEITIDMKIDGTNDGTYTKISPSTGIESVRTVNSVKKEGINIFMGQLYSMNYETGDNVGISYDGIMQPIYFWAGYNVSTVDSQHFTQGDYIAQYTSLANTMPKFITVSTDKAWATIHRAGTYRFTLHAAVEASSVWQGCEVLVKRGTTNFYAARSYCLNNNSMTLTGIMQCQEGDQVQYRKYSDGVCDLAYLRGSIERIF